jgi:hypothetical protein
LKARIVPPSEELAGRHISLSPPPRPSRTYLPTSIMRLSTSLLLLSPLLASLVSAGCHKQPKGHRRHHHKHQKVIKHSSQAASASTHFSKVAGDPTAVLAGKQHTSTPTSSSAASSSAAAQPSNGGTPSSHASSSKPTSTPSAPSSGSWGLKGHAKNNIFVGMLPDDGQSQSCLCEVLR